MKIAFVYDHINRIGGAERILVALHELYPSAPFFTAVYDSQKALWAKDFSVTTSFMQRLPAAKTSHELYPGIPFLAFEQFDFADFDVVISITSAEAKAVITPPQTLHICYCLTPTRYLWSHYYTYFKPGLFTTLSFPFVSLLRLYDFFVSFRPDVYLAISKTVAERIKKFYHQTAPVLYPPVETQKFVPTDEPPDEYFLIVSRLVSYKRIEIAIAACNKLEKKLIIIGEGPQKSKLKSLGGPHVQFLSGLTDEELISYYQKCKALLFTAEEDFGITMVEALACGRPVIAYGKGAASEILTKDCGLLFESQTSESLIAVINRFETITYNKESCVERARLFSKQAFQKQFVLFLRKEWEKFSISHRL
jgi:glycosyltransferase involved in cell wall biosynthesis